MKQNFMYLFIFFVQSAILLSSCIKQNRQNEHTNIEEKSAGVGAVKLDAIVEPEAANMIKEFYKAYISGIPSYSGDSLREKYLTRRLIEKVGRMAFATGADPILRAQDTNEYMLKTLSVKELNDRWYMVSFTSNKGGQFEETENIPLKVVQMHGQYKIDYITPEAYDALYGDTLLYDHPKLPKIDTSDPLAFLKTFYGAYAMEYGSMPENLTAKLASLRAKHLTTNALEQFDNAAKVEAADGWSGYDFLIDDFDFDFLQCSSIKVIQLDKDVYQMCYRKKDTLKILKFKVVKQGGQYYIDNIIKDKSM